MAIIKDPSALNPIVAQKAIKFVTMCSEAGQPVILTETLREEITVLIYILQGRFNSDDIKMNPRLPQELNRLRKKYKLWELTPAEFNKKISWTLESNHMTGNAFDFVPIKDGKAWWNAPDPVWEQLGKIGESLGLTWGGRWPSPDKPHLEYRAKES